MSISHLHTKGLLKNYGLVLPSTGVSTKPLTIFKMILQAI